MISRFEKYSDYRDSEVEWLGEIPKHWEIKSLKYILNFTTGATPSSYISGYYEGHEPWVTIADMNGKYIDKTHFISKSGVKNTNMILSPKGSLLYSFKLSVGQVAFATTDLYTNEAIISIHPNSNINLNFWYYSLPIFIIKNANTNIYGAFLLNQDLIKNSTLLFPPKQEQTKIANYLEQKTEQIDKAITQKNELIKLLKERQQILINDAITKGINNTVQMKESNIQWLGKVPNHWNIKRGKYLFVEIDERSKDGKEELLSVSHMTGVTPRSEKNVTMFMSEDYTGSKTCQKDDLVINIMWAWMGALGISDREGIVSSSYGIYRQREINTFNSSYLEYLLKTNDYIAEYNRRSTGLHVSRLRLYSDMFLDMKIAIPPIEEQNAIINFIKENNSKIDKAINLQEEQIERLKELKETLIDSCVTGKVKVP